MEIVGLIILLLVVFVIYTAVSTTVENSIEADRRVAGAPPAGYIWCEEVGEYLSPYQYYVVMDRIENEKR